MESSRLKDRTYASGQQSDDLQKSIECYITSNFFQILLLRRSLSLTGFQLFSGTMGSLLLEFINSIHIVSISSLAFGSLVYSFFDGDDDVVTYALQEQDTFVFNQAALLR